LNRYEIPACWWHTQAGLAREKQKDKTLGCPTKTNEMQRAEIISKRQAGATFSELAKQYGISRLSIARIARTEA
jgi:putative DNA-invertase from lambdoid prophage Rac